MSYRENVHAVAVALAELVRDGGQVTPGDLDAAVTARNAVLDLVQQMHYSATGIRRFHDQRGLVGLAGLERHPVASLAMALRRDTVTSPVPLTDAIAARPTDPAAQRWRHAARHATLAVHDLTTAEPGTLPTREATWSEIADVAALAEALNTATADLAHSAEAAGRPLLAETLTLATSSGVTTAARTVARLAATGPTPRVGDPVATQPPLVLVVRDVREVPDGLHRLAHLLRAAREISPSQVQRIARTLAVASTDAATVLAAAGPEYADGIEALQRQARSLARVTSSPRRLASIMPGDEAPLAQARLVQQALTAARDARRPLTERQALDVAHAAADATRETARAVRRQVDTLRWFTPAEGAQPGSLEWEPALRAPVEPALPRHVRLALKHARQAARWLPTVGPDGVRQAPWPAPREVLAGALAARRAGAATVRPPTPSMAPTLHR